MSIDPKAFETLIDTAHRRIHRVRLNTAEHPTQFPTNHTPFGKSSRVVGKVIFNKSHGCLEFSGRIVITLEGYELIRLDGKDVIVCIWCAQVLPEDLADTDPISKKFLETIEEILSALQTAPLILGSAFVMLFGHCGIGRPVIDVRPLPLLGKMLNDERLQEEARTRKKNWFNTSTMFKWLRTEPAPRPSALSNDEWWFNNEVAHIEDALRTLTRKFIQQLESHPKLAQRMLDQGVLACDWSQTYTKVAQPEPVEPLNDAAPSPQPEPEPTKPQSSIEIPAPPDEVIESAMPDDPDSEPTVEVHAPRQGLVFDHLAPRRRKPRRK